MPTDTALACATCRRRIAATGPAFPLDATMTQFRCASCQLAARIAAVVARG